MIRDGAMPSSVAMFWTRESPKNASMDTASVRSSWTFCVVNRS